MCLCGCVHDDKQVLSSRRHLPCATPTHTVDATVTLPFFALFVCARSVTVLSPNTGLVACLRLWPPLKACQRARRKKSKLFLKLCCCNSAPVFFLPSGLFLNPISLCNHTLLWMSALTFFFDLSLFFYGEQTFPCTKGHILALVQSGSLCLSVCIGREVKPNHYSSFDLLHQCVYFYKENLLRGKGGRIKTLQAAAQSNSVKTFCYH